MKNNGWVKFYRKIVENGILKDHTAWAVFSWLLLMVDRETGKRTIGRFQMSDELGIKPNTLYKVLHRLENKWEVISLVSQKTYTEVLILNWDKYQGEVKQQSNDSQTPVKQSSPASNTKQEVKNKELRRETGTSKNSLIPCTEDELIELSKELEVSIGVVKKTHNVILNKIKAGEFKNKTVYYTLSNWVLGDIQKGFVVKQKNSPKVHYREVLDKEGKVVSYETV